VTSRLIERGSGGATGRAGSDGLNDFALSLFFSFFFFILRFNRLYIKTKATETLNASLKP